MLNFESISLCIAIELLFILFFLLLGIFILPKISIVLRDFMSSCYFAFCVIKLVVGGVYRVSWPIFEEIPIQIQICLTMIVFNFFIVVMVVSVICACCKLVINEARFCYASLHAINYHGVLPIIHTIRPSLLGKWAIHHAGGQLIPNSSIDLCLFLWLRWHD